MTETVRMPGVLASTTEAAVHSWSVAPGDRVAVGDVLAEVETEKAIVQVAAEAEGTVAALLVDEGVSVPVGEPILELLVGAERTARAGVPASAGQSLTDRIVVSPRARNLAREHGIALSGIAGTGPGGRIVRRDVEALRRAQSGGDAVATASPAESAEVVARSDAETVAGTDESWIIPLTGMRRAIARRLTESTSTVPQFSLTAHCDVGELLRLRAQANEVATQRLSVNDFVVKAASLALIDVPRARVVWSGDHLRGFRHADISIAAAADEGLLAPVVRGLDVLSIGELSARIADASERARAGRLRPDELGGGSFAVSNLGMYGVDEFRAIINPPQSGILAVGAISDRVVAVDGAAVVRPTMTVTVTWDHRAIDGAVGAQWLRSFVRRVEQPISLLV